MCGIKTFLYHFIHFSVNIKLKKNEVKYNLFKRKEEMKERGKERKAGGWGRWQKGRKPRQREREEVRGGKVSLFFLSSLFLGLFIAQVLEELPINHYVNVFISHLFFNFL